MVLTNFRVNLLYCVIHEYHNTVNKELLHKFSPTSYSVIPSYKLLLLIFWCKFCIRWRYYYAVFSIFALAVSQECINLHELSDSISFCCKLFPTIIWCKSLHIQHLYSDFFLLQLYFKTNALIFIKLKIQLELGKIITVNHVTSRTSTVNFSGSNNIFWNCHIRVIFFLFFFF